MIHLQPNKLIRLGGKLYDIRYNPEDSGRRERGEYSPQELKLLNDIGLTNLDTQLSANDKKELPAFFEALPNCQTGAAIALSAKCYQPHYILESIRRYAEEQEQKQYEEMLKMPTPAIDTMALVKTGIDGISNLITGSVPTMLTKMAETSVDSEEMYDFFLLRING